MENTVGKKEILAAQRILAKKIIEQGGCLDVLCDVNIITIDTGVEVEFECPLYDGPWNCSNVGYRAKGKVKLAKKWLAAHPEEEKEV